MTKKEKFARALLSPINPAAIIILGVYTVTWGLWVANPWWEVFTSAQLYGIMAIIAPEVFWGCLAIVVGLVTMYGAYTRRHRPLIVGALAACWHWGMIAILYFFGDPTNTGGITSLTFATYAAFIYLNLRVNHQKRKRMTKILH